VELSLFADDSAAYKSGRNLSQLINDIQKALDFISNWCDDWGLRISLTKTNIVIFTHRIKYKTKPIIINGNEIKITDKTKFLGMIFDKRLTWRHHIQYVVDRCKARLNLMRSLTGTGWGASKTALLTVYRALIRSLLDYGAEALDSASHGAIAKLDSIQYRALKICCGAMAGTSLQALQVECGELPLALRRLRQQLRYSIKVKSRPEHPAGDVLKDHWANHYGKNTKNFFAKTKDFFDGVSLPHPRPDAEPPWSRDPLSIDCSLSRVLRKSDPELNCKVLALGMIHEYADRMHIYTDGSKDREGHVSCSVCVPERDVNLKFRLPDNLSVFTAELEAIRKAFELSRDYCNAGESRRFVIFSDSLSAIQSLDSIRPLSRPDIVEEIFELKHQINSAVTIAWIPAHVGIAGNELADRLAKEALSHPAIDTALKQDSKDILDKIDEYIYLKWQNNYNATNGTKHLKKIQAVVNNKIKYTDPSRDKEVFVTRLRLGVCQLKYYLHKQKNHASGLCGTCGVPDTIEHYLMYCRGNNIYKEIQKTCRTLKLVFCLDSILNNRTVINTLYKYRTGYL
jgi:ribonuclease HI